MTRRCKQVYWFQHLDAWRRSGCSQADYCLLHGLSPSSFAYWRRRQAEPSGHGMPVLEMVPVRVEPEPKADSERVAGSGLVMRGPGGWSLELPAHTPAAWVAALLGALP